MGAVLQVRRITGCVVLVGLLAACGPSGSPGSANRSGTPSPTKSGAALITHTDSAFSLSYPAQWDYKEGTGRYGIYNNFIGPKAGSGYEPAVLVGRTVAADAQTFADGMTLFRTIHSDRKLQPAQSAAVQGAVKADIVRSTRTFKGTPIQSWNVFVLTPSRVALNVEFVAPTAEFDTPLMQQILDSLVAR